jgi:hypothetical protein
VTPHSAAKWVPPGSQRAEAHSQLQLRPGAPPQRCTLLRLGGSWPDSPLGVHGFVWCLFHPRGTTVVQRRQPLLSDLFLLLVLLLLFAAGRTSRCQGCC